MGNISEILTNRFCIKKFYDEKINRFYIVFDF